MRFALVSAPLQLREMPVARSHAVHFPGLTLRLKYLSACIIAKYFLAPVRHKYMGCLFTLTRTYKKFRIVKFFGHPEMSKIATRTIHEL